MLAKVGLNCKGLEKNPQFISLIFQVKNRILVVFAAVVSERTTINWATRKNAQIDILGLFQTNLNQQLEADKKMSSIAKDRKKSVKLHVFEFFEYTTDFFPYLLSSVPITKPRANFFGYFNS